MEKFQRLEKKVEPIKQKAGSEKKIQENKWEIVADSFKKS